MFSAGNVILALKIAVLTVTVLLCLSIWALLRGNFRLHGRINMAFFALTITALVGLEVVARLIEPTMFNRFFDETGAWTELYWHLGFALPSAVLLPMMLFSGLRHKRRWHVTMACFFLMFWIGTVITGVFFLPHEI